METPSHPRSGKGGARLTEPLGYIQFMNLVRTARAVITDSGGVQEESTYLGIPCLTLRENTERPITVSEGSNRLVPSDQLFTQVQEVLAGRWPTGRRPALWDGQTASVVWQRSDGGPASSETAPVTGDFASGWITGRRRLLELDSPPWEDAACATIIDHFLHRVASMLALLRVAVDQRRVASWLISRGMPRLEPCTSCSAVG